MDQKLLMLENKILRSGLESTTDDVNATEHERAMNNSTSVIT